MPEPSEKPSTAESRGCRQSHAHTCSRPRHRWAEMGARQAGLARAACPRVASIPGRGHGDRRGAAAQQAWCRARHLNFKCTDTSSHRIGASMRTSRWISRAGCWGGGGVGDGEECGDLCRNVATASPATPTLRHRSACARGNATTWLVGVGTTLSTRRRKRRSWSCFICERSPRGIDRFYFTQLPSSAVVTMWARFRV